MEKKDLWKERIIKEKFNALFDTFIDTICDIAKQAVKEFLGNSRNPEDLKCENKSDELKLDANDMKN